jgi:hypothetical protein
MKSLTAFALAVVSCVPAMAQFGGMGRAGFPQVAQTKKVEIEILELEQEADKAALKEALSLQAHQGMMLESESQKNLAKARADVLRDFIAKKKEAIAARDTALRKSRSAGK